MGPVATAIITIVGTATCLGLALWFWRRGQANAQAGELPKTNREGDTVFIPKDQLFGQASAPDDATAFVDPREAFRAADRARAQAAGLAQEHGADSTGPGSTEYIPREQLRERIGASKRD